MERGEDMGARAFVLRHPAVGWLTLAALPVLLWFLAAHFPDPNSRDYRARFAAVRTGMPRPDVERLLGGPPGDYWRRPRFRLIINHLKNLPAERRPYTLNCWNFDEGVVEVAFDRDGRVAGTYWEDPDGRGTTGSE